MNIFRRSAVAAVAGATAVTLILAGCSSNSAEQSATNPSPSAPETREAGAVTMSVQLCVTNGTSSDLDFAPVGPYGEFTLAKPGQESCFAGDFKAGDPVVAITFPNDKIVYAYGRNPVFGRPDIRLCSDKDCSSVQVQFDLSENPSPLPSRSLNGITYTANRLKDSDTYKLLKLRVA